MYTKTPHLFNPYLGAMSIVHRYYFTKHVELYFPKRNQNISIAGEENDVQKEKVEKNEDHRRQRKTRISFDEKYEKRKNRSGKSAKMDDNTSPIWS